MLVLMIQRAKIQMFWITGTLFRRLMLSLLLVLEQMMAFTMQTSCRPKVQTCCQNIPIHRGCLNRYGSHFHRFQSNAIFHKILPTANANNYDNLPLQKCQNLQF